MAVIFYNGLKRSECLSKEPYLSFKRKFRALKSIEGEEIELVIDTGKEGFNRGFYTDSFMHNAKLRFRFAELDGKNGEACFIRMTYSFDCHEDNFRYYRHRINTLKKRVPYFYIPSVSHFEFSSELDDEFYMCFDAVAENHDAVLQVCYSLINLIIAILCFED